MSSEGEILGANRAALDILGGNFSDLIGKYLTQDFGWQAWRFLSMSDLTSVSEHVVARTQQRIRVDAIRVGSVVAPAEASGCSTIASRSLATWEEHAVRWVLALNGGNVARAARDLGITLHSTIKWTVTGFAANVGKRSSGTGHGLASCPSCLRRRSQIVDFRRDLTQDFH